MSNEFSVKATIDLHEMDNDDIAELLDHAFRELSSSEKEDFMRLNLDDAAEAIGDHPVINSLTMPVPGGDGFSYVVYHRGDDHFELE